MLKILKSILKYITYLGNCNELDNYHGLLEHRLPTRHSSKESAYNTGDMSWIPGWGRSPGVGNGNPDTAILPRKFHGE